MALPHAPDAGDTYAKRSIHIGYLLKAHTQDIHHGGHGGRTKTRKSKLEIKNAMTVNDPMSPILTWLQHPPIEAFYTRFLFLFLLFLRVLRVLRGSHFSGLAQ
jgi:hypothetical protein